MRAPQTFMLSAAARGLATSPMEGFDEAAVLDAVQAPKRYGVPVAVSLGHGDDGDWFATRESLRFPTRRLFCDDTFHRGWDSGQAVQPPPGGGGDGGEGV